MVITCFFFSLWNLATPLTIMLFDSVAPDVKMMSFASAPMSFATCCKGRRISILRVAKILERTHPSSLVDSRFRLPPVCVGPTVRVSVKVGEIRHHGSQHTGIHGCRCLSLASKSTKCPVFRAGMNVPACQGKLDGFCRPVSRAQA